MCRQIENLYSCQHTGFLKFDNCEKFGTTCFGAGGQKDYKRVNELCYDCQLRQNTPVPDLRAAGADPYLLEPKWVPWVTTAAAAPATTVTAAGTAVTVTPPSSVSPPASTALPAAVAAAGYGGYPNYNTATAYQQPYAYPSYPGQVIPQQYQQQLVTTPPQHDYNSPPAGGGSAVGRSGGSSKKGDGKKSSSDDRSSRKDKSGSSSGGILKKDKAKGKAKEVRFMS